MLDKTIPYHHIIMKRRAGIKIPSYPLPKGYSFAWHVSGKEQRWAQIETAVGEFENYDKALEYFHKEYSPHLDDVRKRVLYIHTKDQEEVGTITGWWNWTGERRDPSIHWFAVKKEHQGVGIGKALVSECLNRLVLLEGDRDVYLHTQTWSYQAIGLYRKLGFDILETESFGGYPNDFARAMPIVRKAWKNSESYRTDR